MTTQHSDPPHEPTDQRSEVLSDATNLDALLEAILGDELASVATQVRPPHDMTAPAAAPDAPPRIAAVPPSTPEVVAEPILMREIVADDKWGFVDEDPPAGNEIAHDFSAVRQEAPASAAPAGSLPAWRDKLRVSWSGQSLLVAALSAAALITASAISLRDEPTATEPVASSDAAAPVQSSPLVQNANVVKATDVSEVEVRAAAREPVQRPRVVSRTPSRRSNEVSKETSPPPKPAFVEAPRSAATASPVVASPPVVERITQATDRDAAPSRTAIPAESEQPRLTDSTPAGPASGASVVNRAEAAPTPAAPVAPAEPRRTAARLVTGPAPEYPQALRTARIGGSVEVLITIDATGRVVNARSLTGHPQLRSAAEAAAKRWRYEAARLDNLAVETQTMVRFNFDPSTDRRPQE